VGRALAPELKCTARGGCCATPTGRRLAEAFRRQRDPDPGAPADPMHPRPHHSA